MQDIRGKFTPSDLFRWLWDGDYYFIIGHVHQGLDNMNVHELWDKLSWLASREGFPGGLQLRCPVFTQDKFVYITACREITLPTLKIVFDEYGDAADDVARTRFPYSCEPRMLYLHEFMKVCMPILVLLSLCICRSTVDFFTET